VGATGELKTVNGDAIIGDQGPVRIPPGTSVQFSPDGTISANGALVGKLKLVEFADNSTLSEISPGTFLTDSTPAAARNSLVRQGSLESSNVNPVDAAVGLIAIQRHAEMLQRALTIFHTEFNRIAAGELSRV
jgi:flagellar basal-body rod protein FlgF/flagellar basal-body rod protein FlgG